MNDDPQRCAWIAGLAPVSRTVRLRVQVVDPAQLGPFMGATLHGALGRALSRIKVGLETWMLPLPAPAHAPSFVRASPPAPVVIVPPAFGSASRLRPGDELELGFVLLGPAATGALVFFDAVGWMAERGLGPRRARLRILDAWLGGRRAGHRRVAAASEPERDPPASLWPPDPPCEPGGARAQLRLRTRTPLHLRENGKLVARPSAADVVRAAVRRLLALAWTFGTRIEGLDTGGRELVAAARALGADGSRDAEPGDGGTHWKRWTGRRWSGRQEQRHPLEGVVGELALGEVPDWALTALRCARRFGVGKGPSLGLGHYELVEAS